MHEPANTVGKRRGDKDEAEESVRYTVLSRRAIAVWAVLIVAAGVGMAVWLLLAYGTGDARLQLDAIRTAGTLVVGAGGAAALLLAARRQRSTEIALKQTDRDQLHQERVAATTEVDATTRRITDLYTRAAKQFGSDKAHVRLAGLYALERLAQDNPPPAADQAVGIRQQLVLQLHHLRRGQRRERVPLGHDHSVHLSTD